MHLFKHYFFRGLDCKHRWGETLDGITKTQLTSPVVSPGKDVAIHAQTTGVVSTS
jgi:hypothetical protein